jgi:hypothetical protein
LAGENPIAEFVIVTIFSRLEFDEFLGDRGFGPGDIKPLANSELMCLPSPVIAVFETSPSRT